VSSEVDDWVLDSGKALLDISENESSMIKGRALLASPCRITRKISNNSSESILPPSSRAHTVINIFDLELCYHSPEHLSAKPSAMDMHFDTDGEPLCTVDRLLQ
jgi:hypothetical protein